MRKKINFDGKNRIFDTDKAEALGQKDYGYFGDPAGYSETIYKTKAGLYFAYGIGGADSPYPEEDIHALTEDEANARLA